MIKNMKVRVFGITTALVLTLAAGCATTAYQASSAAPLPCADSAYVRLKQQHADSLSEREWQRLESLDRQCADARLADSRKHSTSHAGWMGMGRATGIGLMTAIMIVMIVTM